MVHSNIFLEIIHHSLSLLYKIQTVMITFVGMKALLYIMEDLRVSNTLTYIVSTFNLGLLKFCQFQKKELPYISRIWFLSALKENFHTPQDDYVYSYFIAFVCKCWGWLIAGLLKRVFNKVGNCTSSSPGTLLEMHILGPYHRSTESGLMLKFEKH